MEQATSSEKTSDPLENWLSRADEYARREPAKAAVSAFGAGFLINLLPIGAIVGALASVALMMARPVLLFLGVLKVCELCRSKNHVSP